MVDEAQELTDAEWQMLLRRCPSREFYDRQRPRPGQARFTESWQERLKRIGVDTINLASLSINCRTPQEVMAEAESVIRAVLPAANEPTSVRSNGCPSSTARLPTWTRYSIPGSPRTPKGIACVIDAHGSEDDTVKATPRVRLLTPKPSKGLEFVLVALLDPDAFGAGGAGIEGTVDRYVAMTRATQQLVILTST